MVTRILKTTKKGLVSISPELLLSLLKIKEGAILDIRVNHFESSRIEIVIVSPDMPDCPEGAYPVPIDLELG